MRYEKYVPNEIIVDKAVSLLKKMLANPKYENLSKTEKEQSSGASFFQNSMAQALASMIPKNNTTEVLDLFAIELKKILMTEHEENNYIRYIDTLSVDYHPDQFLNKAAQLSGLKMEFPWKTQMWLHNNKIGLGYGYGSETVYYYPIFNNTDWLATTLSGSDISKVIELIENAIINKDTFTKEI